MKTGLSNVGAGAPGGGGWQAGRQAGKRVEEKEGGSTVTCLEYQSTEETKPFQEV